MNAKNSLCVALSFAATLTITIYGGYYCFPVERTLQCAVVSLQLETVAISNGYGMQGQYLTHLFAYINQTTLARHIPVTRFSLWSPDPAAMQQYLLVHNVQPCVYDVRFRRLREFVGKRKKFGTHFLGVFSAGLTLCLMFTLFFWGEVSYKCQEIAARPPKQAVVTDVEMQEMTTKLSLEMQEEQDMYDRHVDL